MAAQVRHPAVAGRFYPRDPDNLRAEVESYLSPPQKAAPALGCVVPHAGYMYSGHVAGAVYGRLEVPQRSILCAPTTPAWGFLFPS